MVTVYQELRSNNVYVQRFMDDLRFYVHFNSISVIQDNWGGGGDVSNTTPFTVGKISASSI